MLWDLSCHGLNGFHIPLYVYLDHVCRVYKKDQHVEKVIYFIVKISFFPLKLQAIGKLFPHSYHLSVVDINLKWKQLDEEFQGL